MDTGVTDDTTRTTEGTEGDGASSGGFDVKAPKPFGSRAPAFIKKSKPLHMTWQIGVGIVGFAIILAGLAMLILPGPGWAAVFVGLAVLGTEFVWAQRTLLWTKDKVTKAANRALDPKTRRRNMIMLIVGLILLGAAAGVYLWKFGLGLPS